MFGATLSDIATNIGTLTDRRCRKVQLFLMFREIQVSINKHPIYKDLCFYCFWFDPCVQSIKIPNCQKCNQLCNFFKIQDHFSVFSWWFSPPKSQLELFCEESVPVNVSAVFSWFNVSWNHKLQMCYPLQFYDTFKFWIFPTIDQICSISVWLAILFVLAFFLFISLHFVCFSIGEMRGKKCQKMQILITVLHIPSHVLSRLTYEFFQSSCQPSVQYMFRDVIFKFVSCLENLIFWKTLKELVILTCLKNKVGFFWKTTLGLSSDNVSNNTLQSVN